MQICSLCTVLTVYQAIKIYRQAAELASKDDYLPWSNLSAAQFECGNYFGCTSSALQALVNVYEHESSTRSDKTAVERKLAPRLIKAFLHVHEYKDARHWLDVLQSESKEPPSEEISLYRTAIDRAEAVWAAFPDEKTHRLHLLRHLPRYRPAFSGYHEYFNIGHDDISDLIPVDALVDDVEYVSVFLGGVGDARHFYGALAFLGISERVQVGTARKAGVREFRVNKKYHFTLNDRKAGALARDMIVFALLDVLAVAKDMPSFERLQRYAVVFYVFIGAIMPRFAFDHLNRVIDMLVEKQERKDTILPWLRIYESDRAGILRALRSWRSGSLISLFSTRDVISLARSQFREAGVKAASLFGFDPRRAPSGCEKEYATYKEAPFLLPPRQVLKDHEPELQRLLESGASADRLREYLSEHWCVNPTLLDEDWMVEARGELDVGYDPFELPRRLQALFIVEEKGARQRKRLFDYAADFFQMVVLGLRRVRDRLSVELILDDLAAAIDALRHGLIEGRDRDAPTTFDVVYLSNVPDYIGGSFVTFVSGLKLLNNTTTAKITSTCLRNTGIWKSQEQFHSEYIIVNDFNTLFKLTQAQFVKRDEYDTLFPMSGYMDWRRATMKKFPYEFPVPRAELSRWLFAHFFKLALPCSRDPDDHNLDLFLFPTLNLTNFFRLLIHLHEIGYPAHWLADVLAKILENQVVTTARPPRTLPLEVDEVSRRHPAAKLSTAPYILEMTTLTVLFQRILPFCPITTASLPSPGSIYSYSVRMRTVDFPMHGEMQALVLIFFRVRLPPRCPGTADDIHRYLDPSPEKDKSFETPAMKEFRESGSVVITALTWNGVDDRTATIWMREDVMDPMIEAREDDEWVCCLWRVDDWAPVSSAPEGAKMVVKGARWGEFS